MGSLGKHPPTDDQVLAAARAGDTDRLAEFFEYHRSRLERIARLRLDRRLQGRLDPADVVQETYIAAQQKFTNHFVASGLPFFLWLRLELSQKLVEAHRRHLGARMRSASFEVSLHRGAMPQVSSVSLAERLLGRLTTASQAAIRAEVKLQLQEVLNQMDARDREVLVLRHFEELSNSEAAQVLGLSPTAACNRYVRALKRLKDALDDLPDGLPGFAP
jgi:RNA polymerase sigma-70 factor (ECF subfamily)